MIKRIDLQGTIVAPMERNNVSQRIRASVERLVQHFESHPEVGVTEDRPAVARIEKGLRCKAEGPNGFELTTDLSSSAGGDGSAPSPGWCFRAALANCDATILALRAAQLGWFLTRVEVTVESTSDDRAMFGLVSIPPGPQEVRVSVILEGPDLTRGQKQELVDWIARVSPVGDALKRAIPVTMRLVT